MRRTALLLLGLQAAVGLLRAADASAVEIPSLEALAPPTSARVSALTEAGRSGNWAGVALAARRAAFTAYAQDRISAAGAWYRMEQWARLFGETEAAFTQRWLQTLSVAGANHRNMATRWPQRDRLMAADLSAGFEQWLLGNASFSEEFFEVLTPVDYVPSVLATLAELYAADPVRLREYQSLALALAVVEDVPAPPDWPHGQVTTAALPRGWPPVREAFNWWVQQDRAGRTYHRLGSLGADELKFVVDAAAPFSELEWSQRAVSFPLGDFSRTYSMVKYSLTREQAQVAIWPGSTYRLEDILSRGGICVDQAYFASEAGKARGVPTLLFQGEGLDGRHAWFGYLDQNNAWQLDAGRYAEQRFITGVAYDPQTWMRLSDHELLFLTERFRDLPSYGQSEVHAAIANEFLREGRPADAVASARKAVNYERRNVAAWEILLAAQKVQNASAVAMEATLQEAMQAFQRYPDLESDYGNRLIASLRASGETSRANFQERQLAAKYQAKNRVDLSIQQAAEMLQRSFATQDVSGQIRTYNRALATYGPGAGTDFFDHIVVVFAEHLMQLRQNAAATQAVDRARQVLGVTAGSQLDQDMRALSRRVAR